MRIFATALTISFGLITLIALLVGDWLVRPDILAQINSVLSTLLQLVTITVALSVLIGVLNLLVVHFRRVSGRQRGALPSVFLILSFVLVTATYIVQRPTSLILLDTVQVSIESALAALVLFALVYGAATVMSRRASISGVIFVVVVLIVLVAALPLAGIERVASVRDWLMNVPVNAGARGILLGIALATLVTGVRVLIGQDRSYRE